MENLSRYLTLIKDHKQRIKPAVIVIVMIAAVVVFGTYGENQKTLTQFETGDAGAEAPLNPELSGSGSAGSEEAEGRASAIFVDIGGEVKNPGVYEVVEGTRLFEVIEKAGGLTKNADVYNLNQAETVSDGQKIIIPEEGERSGDGGGQGGNTSGTGSASGYVGGGSGGNTGAGGFGQTFTADGRVNINTADETGLQEIPGVGPATAKKIISYREAHGRFSAIEEIKNVSGIGEKTFEKMKDMIGV